MSARVGSSDQTKNYCFTTANIQYRQLEASFYHFLSTSLEDANTDRLKLAHKQWKLLKNSNVIMPNLINDVFNSYDGTKETLDTFLQMCEEHAFSIKQTCHEYNANKTCTSFI